MAASLWELSDSAASINPYSPFLSAEPSVTAGDIGIDDFLVDFPYQHPVAGVPDFIGCFDEGLLESSTTIAAPSEPPRLVSQVEEVDDTGNNYEAFRMMNDGNPVKRAKTDIGCRIGFRMKSEVEILDDGFKWRKYGKKSVKNSPNPRNYYKCSSPECGVKKRVERDRDDPRYVITMYDGVHNHASPGVLHYVCAPQSEISWVEMPTMAPNVWTAQAVCSNY